MASKPGSTFRWAPGSLGQEGAGGGRNREEQVQAMEGWGRPGPLHVPCGRFLVLLMENKLALFPPL